MNYWREVEYRAVTAAAGFAANQRVLDIGSPKLLALYLAERVGCEVWATDIVPYFLDDLSCIRALRRISPDRLHLDTQDGRHLTFPDASFDRVYSISVVEHIPEDGDLQCLREIGRVLRPGGRAIVTVPFGETSRDEYRRGTFYWARASRSEQGKGTFYQRRYSEDDLMRRLIAPSGLALASLSYIGEWPALGGDREIGTYLPAATGPLQPALSRLLHTGPTPSWRELEKPLCAVISLDRPSA